MKLYLFFALGFLFSLSIFGAELKEDLKKIAELGRVKDKYIDDGGRVSSDQFKQLNADFVRAVQAKVSAFSEIKVLQQNRTNYFNKITLNRTGAGFDAVRFKNDSDDPKDLVWMFAFPKGALARFYIVPVSGSMRGFGGRSGGAEHYAVAPWNGLSKNYDSIIQTLAGGEIKPHSEYIIWFLLSGEQPEDFYMAINLIPVRNWVAGPRLLEMDLGLEKVSSGKTSE